MTDAAALHFPLPTIVDGKRHEGSLVRWPTQCVKCPTRECEVRPSTKIDTCSFGYDYVGITEKTLVAGILVNDLSKLSGARAKRMRKERSQYVSRIALSNFTTSFTDAVNQRQADLDNQKRRIIREYVESQQYRSDFLADLKPLILKGLSFVHDYKQINTAINQNVNVLLETRYEGATLEDKLAKAAEYEKALYWAAKFLVEKLNAARFLIHPDAINKPSDYGKFRFHGLVHKYVRIFTPRFQEKKVHLHVSGTSYAEIVANGEAVGVIPQTFLDNALKYSSPHSKVEVLVGDEQDGVRFSVTSHGPRIFDDEKQKVFHPFYRGRAAEAQEEEGAGYGLYLAQLIAREHLNTQIEVAQDPHTKPQLGHLTTFSVILPLLATNAR